MALTKPDIKKNNEYTLSISALSSEGTGISKIDDGYVIFVTDALPGDKVLCKILKVKQNYASAGLIKILELSSARLHPECSYFGSYSGSCSGSCGGCKLQHLDYQHQLEHKTQTVLDALTKIGSFENINPEKTIQSNNIFFYRNKMEFSFSDDKWLIKKDMDSPKEKFALGLHIPRFHTKILDIEKCYLQSEVSNNILNFTRNFFKTRSTSVYSTKTHTGLLRFLVIRQSKNTRDLMVNLITSRSGSDKELISEYSNSLIESIPQITTVVNGITTSKAAVAFCEDVNILHGSGFIYEKLGDEDFREFNPVFKISPNSFFQTNTNQAFKLFCVAKEFLSPVENDNVLDLYCGAGSISIFISESVKSVTGVELIPDSIDNANENLKINSVSNVNFICSDILDYVKSNSVQEFNKLILDPPRSGLHPEICRTLAESDFEKIIYVSCNSQTQARDLKIICGGEKYKIEKIQPVDMFPQTYHIENVVSLVRK
jgi:23S rRNA (uracil1939-C5)-methyltransferase